MRVMAMLPRATMVGVGQCVSLLVYYEAKNGQPLLSNDLAVMEDITQASGKRVKLTYQAADEVGEPDPGIRWC